MPSPGPYVLAALVAVMAATGRTHAQDRTSERRLVQAFIRYCIGTAADPNLLRAEIEKGASLSPHGWSHFPNGSFVDTAEILDSTGRRDPHQRMLIRFGQGLGNNERRRTCQVNIPWGEKASFIAELVDNLTVAGGTSTIVREGQYETDLTRWTTRVGNTEAVVELGMPTFAGAPGRAITLTVEGQ